MKTESIKQEIRKRKYFIEKIQPEKLLLHITLHGFLETNRKKGLAGKGKS